MLGVPPRSPVVRESPAPAATGSLLYGGDATRMRALLARRGVPVARGGLLGWVHHEDAAAATVAALEHGRPGEAYNIVDDLPATWADVFTAMADAVGDRKSVV